MSALGTQAQSPAITLTGVPFLYNPINHLAAINDWARGGKAIVNLSADTFRLSIRQQGRILHMYPQFVAMAGDVPLTSLMPMRDGTFIGWNADGDDHRWKLGMDKVRFKLHMARLGLRVPAAWSSGQALAAHFIVKPRAGTYSGGIRGPFETGRYDFGKPLTEGEYFEQFVPGVSVKSWVYNGRVVASERFAPAWIMGDGTHSIRAIYEKPRGSFEPARRLDRFDAVLAWQSLTPDSIPAAGKKVFLEFRHNDLDFHKPSMLDPDVWPSLALAVRHQIAHAANLVHGQIPAAQRHRALFSLDAVVDRRQRVWFLEINSHPGILHPKIYAPMLDSLLGASGRSASSETRSEIPQ